MNKEITDELMVKWVDHKLTATEQAELEVILLEDSELAGELSAMRSVKAKIQKEIPASVEPPYPDFFNNQLMRKVMLDQVSRLPKEKAKRWWKSLQWAWAPAGAMALVLAFLAGQRLGQEGGESITRSVATSSLTSVYFSEDSLNAEIIPDAEGDVSAIIVTGLSAISDDASFAEIKKGELPVSYQRAEAKRFH
jgi:anti-sigma factor RsiW